MYCNSTVVVAYWFIGSPLLNPNRRSPHHLPPMALQSLSQSPGTSFNKRVLHSVPSIGNRLPTYQDSVQESGKRKAERRRPMSLDSPSKSY